MLDTIFSLLSQFYGWLSTTYIVPGVSLMTFIVSVFIVTIVVYVVLPFNSDE